MKSRVLFAAFAVVLLCGGFSAARATVNIRGILTAGRYQPTVDTVYVYTGRDTLRWTIAGWSAVPGVDDTVDFPALEAWPAGLKLSMINNSLRYPYNIPNVQRDTWYYWGLGAPPPGVRFYLPAGVEESPAAIRSVAGLKASPSLFQTGTRLSFNVNVAARVRVEVCDATGRTVRTLLAGERPVGACNVAWNARDDSDRAVQPGVYFARVSVGSDRLIAKLVLTD